VRTDTPPETVETSRGETAYRELVEDHADRLYGVAMLILGDPAIAQQVMVRGFERTWDAIRRDQLVADAVETIYWSVTREALRRLVRSRGDLRGLLPATIADDRQVTAFGITSGFQPQQQAAIYLAVWAGLDYRLAGLASGVGEGRVRDLVFSARQEYREVRGSAADDSALCREAAPLLSTRADGEMTSPNARLDEHIANCPTCRQTAANFDEFTSMLRAIRIPSAAESPADAALAVLRARPEGRRRWPLLRIVSGPAILVVFLIASLVVFRGFGEPSIGTGVGRTSDLLYARDVNSAIVILDSGSGRELGRLPNGVLAPNGQRVYSMSTTCQEGGCTSAIRVTDTATMSTNPVGRLDGRLALLGVDEQRGRLYLADSDGSRLIAFDSSLGQVVQAVDAPEDVRGAFASEGAVFVPGGPTLFTLASGAADGSTGAVVTDLSAMRILGSTSLPGARDEYASLLPDPSRGHLYAHQLGAGALHEVDYRMGRVIASAQLDPGAGDAVAVAEDGGTVARVPDGSALYAVVTSGGIGVVRAEPLQLLNRIAADKQYRSVATSSDGRLLYVIEQDGSYAVLQSSDGQQMLRRSNVGAVALLQANAGE
jgi:DNA-directed RNA polymerase specialized sigma24 family protein